MLLVNLRMDATYVKEGMNVNWVAEVSRISFFGPKRVCVNERANMSSSCLQLSAK